MFRPARDRMMARQVHYYYDFSDAILPPDVPINRPFKIAMDQTIFFITKCAAYVALVRTLEDTEMPTG